MQRNMHLERCVMVGRLFNKILVAHGCVGARSTEPPTHELAVHASTVHKVGVRYWVTKFVIDELARAC